MNDIIAKQFNADFKLESPSGAWYLEHLHADFIELKTLFWQQDEWLTLTDVIGHYKDSFESIGDRNEHVNEVGSESGENNDKLYSKFIGIFQIIKERKSAFADEYPFEIDSVNNYIKLPKIAFSEKQLLYIELLLSANLNNFNPNIQSILTTDFERVAASAMQGYFPGAVVKEFGKNSTYKGNTIKKIEDLSIELNVSMREHEIKKLAITAAQEKGLDLLAYIPFSDSISSMLVVLGQCACGKDWPKKVSETTNYEAYLDFYKLRPVHSIFVPYSLAIDNTRGFFQSETLTDRLLFERKRILESIKDTSFSKHLNSLDIVRKAIELVAFEV